MKLLCIDTKSVSDMPHTHQSPERFWRFTIRAETILLEGKMVQSAVNGASPARAFAPCSNAR